MSAPLAIAITIAEGVATALFILGWGAFFGGFF